MDSGKQLVCRNPFKDITDTLQNRYTKFSTKTSEEFNTASRSVKPGLIASGIVSAWTWAATLLQSSTVAYEYGIAGPFWVCPIDVLALPPALAPN